MSYIKLILDNAFHILSSFQIIIGLYPRSVAPLVRLGIYPPLFLHRYDSVWYLLSRLWVAILGVWLMKIKSFLLNPLIVRSISLWWVLDTANYL